MRTQSLKSYAQANNINTFSRVCINVNGLPYIHVSNNGENEDQLYFASTMKPALGTSIKDLEPKKLKVCWTTNQDGQERLKLSNKVANSDSFGDIDW